MANHFDAEMSDVVVIVNDAYKERLEAAIAALTDAGLKISDVDRDEGTIEGTLDVGRVGDVKKLDCVEYVRTVMTYIADFPPGDPRDQDSDDGDDDQDDEIEGEGDLVTH